MKITVKQSDMVKGSQILESERCGPPGTVLSQGGGGTYVATWQGRLVLSGGTARHSSSCTLTSRVSGLWALLACRISSFLYSFILIMRH